MTPFQIHKIVCSHTSNKKTHLIAEDSTDSIDGDDSAFFEEGDVLRQPTPSSLSEDSREPTPDPPPVGFQYQPIREISLGNDGSPINSAVYHAYKIEGVMLPTSMGSQLIYDTFETNQYVPLRTKYQQAKHELVAGGGGSSGDVTKPKPLYSNFRISKRIFPLRSPAVVDALEEYAEQSLAVNKLLHKQDFEGIRRLLKGKSIDSYLQTDTIWILSVVQILKRLLRKSMILLAMDYYKNVLLKQSLLPAVNYKVKLSISCKCENESVVFIDDITNIIKCEYIPFFRDFSLAGVNLFSGCFWVLNECLVYHFKNGLKYDLNYEEGNNAIKLLGIFSTGFYSIVMERTRVDLTITGSNIISSHLTSHFKKMLIRNNSVDVFEEMKKALDKLGNTFINNVDYENLRLFYEEHARLLRANVHEHSLLGFNNGYIVRLLNSYASILPAHFSNLNPSFDEHLRGQEQTVLTYLFYYATAHVLNATLPCIQAIAVNSFVGTSWELFEFDDPANLIRVFRLVQSPDLQLVAIYLIRTACFFRCRNSYYQNHLGPLRIGPLLDDDGPLSLHDKYTKLLAMKEAGVMDELPVKSFALQKGQFFKRWNYPNTSRLKPKRGSKVSLNKIANRLPTDADLVADFLTANNGFFTHDYDPAPDLAGGHTLAQGATFIDGFEMKTLWKLEVYIRINNL